MSELATRTPMQETLAQVRSTEFRGQVQIALPNNVTPERFVRVAVTAIQQQPDLITCTQASLFQSLIRCAQDGLLPDGREAALVKFGNQAVYMPMIAGFRKIAAEYGWGIDTQVVYENDTFDYQLGVHPRLEHVPAGLEKEPGDKIGAYAVATHEDGRKLVEVMRKADILKVRDVSKSKSSGPWRDWEERMWEKTVGRRIFGKLPLSGRAAERAESLIQAADGDIDHPARAAMSVDEANVAAPLSNVTPPADDGPVDEVLDGEYEQPPLEDA